MGLNFFERLIVKKFASHLLSHWPAHLAWVFPLVVLLSPSLKSYESAHPNALASQVIGIFLTLVARYVGKNVAGAAVVFFALLFAAPSMAQTSTPPAPTQTTMNFQIGAGALGIASTSQATPATDIKLSFNPGFAKMKSLSLLSDNVLAPGANLQYYGAGISYEFSNIFPKTSALAPVSFYLRGSIGADRIVPATGASQSHIAFLAGGGLAWNPSSSVRIQLVEVDDGHFPGASWGPHVPVVSGGLSILFGKQ